MPLSPDGGFYFEITILCVYLYLMIGDPVLKTIDGDSVLFSASVPLHSLLSTQEYPLFSRTPKPLDRVKLSIFASSKDRFLDDIPSLVIANLCLSGVLESPEAIDEIHIVRRESNASIAVTLFL